MSELQHKNANHEYIQNTAESARNFSEQINSPEIPREQHEKALESHLNVAPKHQEHVEGSAEHFKEAHNRAENHLLEEVDNSIEKLPTTKEDFVSSLLDKIEELAKQNSHEDVLTYLFLKAKHKYQKINQSESLQNAA